MSLMDTRYNARERESGDTTSRSLFMVLERVASVYLSRWAAPCVSDFIQQATSTRLSSAHFWLSPIVNSSL